MPMIDGIYDTRATTIPVLRYLVAIADHRHFGRAAAACGVTQPTLSAQLAAWEQRMGVQVCERHARGVRLTPVGERVAVAARQALAALAAVEDAARAEPPFYGPLRLGIIPTVAPYALPWLVPALERAFPKLDLRVREATTAELEAALQAGAIDAALLALLPGMSGEPLYHEAFLAALPQRHRLASLAEIAPAQLAQERLLLLDEGHCLRGQALELCGQASVASGYRATSLATLVRLVAAGHGCTVLPALADEQLPGVVCRPLAGRPTRTIGLRTRPGDPRREAWQQLVAVIRRHAPKDRVRLA